MPVRYKPKLRLRLVRLILLSPGDADWPYRLLMLWFAWGVYRVALHHYRELLAVESYHRRGLHIRSFYDVEGCSVLRGAGGVVYGVVLEYINRPPVTILGLYPPPMLSVFRDRTIRYQFVPYGQLIA